MEGRDRDGHRRPHRRMSHVHPSRNNRHVVKQRSQDSTDSSSSGKKAKERKSKTFLPAFLT